MNSALLNTSLQVSLLVLLFQLFYCCQTAQADTLYSRSKPSSCINQSFPVICPLTHQISDRSQSQHAALRLGVWSEHLHSSAAADSAHCGGGGLSWSGPRHLHSGEEA